jgi:two-component system NtrC family sensor kinase
VVEVSISDNGTGIPEGVQHKVFEPFFTTKPVGKGTGQGLSLARGIVVDAHGGTLSFETQPLQGTTFMIRLPIDGLSKLEPLS